MIHTAKQIFGLFSARERKQVYWLFTGMVIRGGFEVAGVASIMPFIAVVANPDIIQSNRLLFSCYQFLGLESARSFLLVLGVIVLGVIILNNALSAFTDWYLFRFTWLRGYSLSRRLFAKYLSQPYSFFLGVNTAELGANILNEVGNYMKGILRPFMEMAARLIVCLFIFILILMVDPVLAVIVGFVLGSAYSAIFILVRKKLVRVGRERVFNNKRQFMFINEAFGGVKDIKVKGCESYFLESFSNHSRKVNMNQATHEIVSQIPKYALEVVAFGGILLITLYFVVNNQNTEETIPLMALYAFAGYRLMPALQRVFAGITTVKFNVALLEKLYDDLILSTFPAETVRSWEDTPEPLRCIENIEFRDITYCYPSSESLVLKKLNLQIEANTTVGLVGTTGAGKTTLVDILLGLLELKSGVILVDGQQLKKDENRNWLANIGYVPQHIFLSDQSIMNNIALGVPVEQIAKEKVIRAASVANLHEFIEHELPDGYDTVIGERGVRLSGGQKQRIGIARALYHDPDILILDEATSSLDNITESSVMAAIQNLAGKKTIIMIAHRLTTLECCDVIHFLKGGTVIDSGRFVDLEKNCPEFRELANSRKKN
jgi:ABC-type bacteriocin/lantibiotic exporter with double-glycine peptidase domain